ncbi:hypothetical protein GPECTOR_7g1203 [Gonium pectorale]|uniref:Uncharacterized protein n=1 Tax=Gonium pectorale TaxID=33097 RepID=A0A150GTZ8_GONPE|nr:hypothetical protein GPECTOR_7g1203 [Gonium pectorale]|eukprot:KXZ53309.1 hypothetical protein GPECTOR_7g1203 [Gonium pectorale]
MEQLLKLLQSARRLPLDLCRDASALLLHLVARSHANQRHLAGLEGALYKLYGGHLQDIGDASAQRDLLEALFLSARKAGEAGPQLLRSCLTAGARQPPAIASPPQRPGPAGPPPLSPVPPLVPPPTPPAVGAPAAGAEMPLGFLPRPDEVAMAEAADILAETLWEWVWEDERRQWGHRRQELRRWEVELGKMTPREQQPQLQEKEWEEELQRRADQLLRWKERLGRWRQRRAAAPELEQWVLELERGDKVLQALRAPQLQPELRGPGQEQGRERPQAQQLMRGDHGDRGGSYRQVWETQRRIREALRKAMARINSAPSGEYPRVSSYPVTALEVSTPGLKDRRKLALDDPWVDVCLRGVSGGGGSYLTFHVSSEPPAAAAGQVVLGGGEAVAMAVAAAREDEVHGPEEPEPEQGDVSVLTLPFGA